ncbi:hypothetical protein DEO23_12110 [Brachybacterium endophyticum]|uniref:Uncharacterized protein n=2 Tax=Brachybacterium endophyticum TaxID=2182385 RepID=A0A2U2RHI3_9MICO|nr:hypothetical protein DEO23_12110 [Brachybacterium endophyticum]
MKPVLVTPEGSHLSWFLVDALRNAGGHWMVRHTEGRTYDGFHGFSVSSYEDLWDSQLHESPVDRAFPVSTVRPGRALMCEVYSKERAEDRTRIGALTEFLVRSISPARLTRWDVSEPLAHVWSIDSITRSLRSQMPVTQEHLAHSSSKSRAVAASTRVARTHSGLLEHSRAVVELDPLPGAQERESPRAPSSHPAILPLFEGLVDQFRPTIATVSLMDVDNVDGVLGCSVRRHVPEEPLAVLLGPQAVRDLRIDIDAISARHDVTSLGLSRAPSIALRFTGPDPVWNQMLAFIHDLDEERLASALALNIDMLRSSLDAP